MWAIFRAKMASLNERMNNAMWPKFPSRWSYFGDTKILERTRRKLARGAVEIFSEFCLSSFV